MKFLQIFNKTPNTRKFNYTPRFYKPEEEEMRERIQRIERELNKEKQSAEGVDDSFSHRDRMRASFRAARGEQSQAKPSFGSGPMLMRLAILLVLTVGLIAYLQYGTSALYTVAVVIAVFVLYSRIRNTSTRGR